ncbi:MAG: phosphatase PAP2 family protein [Candidatus Binatia bacterium]
MSARPRRSSRHAAILRVLFAGLVACEISGQAGASPSLLEGGLGGLLTLPFFAPALLGSFAAQVLLRPRRLEVAASLALGAALAWPVVAAAPEAGLASCLAAALGMASLLLLVLLLGRAVLTGAEDRGAVLDVLEPALLLPGFVALAFPLGYLTAALWPATLDHRLYLADAAFGAPLSFTVGRWTAAVPLLNDVCLAVYVMIPLALVVVHALRERQGERSSDALVNFIALTVVGYVGYHLVPVVGPLYVFPDQFPLQPPDPATMSAARAVALPMPRNCMPSLHSGWALLVWWSARPLPRGPRLVAAVFLAVTLLSTVALGFHYVVDLVAAFPLTMALQAWGTRTKDTALRRVAMAAGLATTVLWMAAAAWSETFLSTPPPLLWIAAGAIVGGAWWMEGRVHAGRCDVAAVAGRSDEVEAAATATAGRVGWPDFVAALMLAVLGAGVFLHSLIVANALALVFGSSSAVRISLLCSALAGLGLGLVGGSRLALGPVQRWRAAAVLVGVLAVCSWAWPLLFPWTWDRYVDVAAALGRDSAWLAWARVVLASPGIFLEVLLAGAVVALAGQGGPGGGEGSREGEGDDRGVGNGRGFGRLASALGCFLLGVAAASLATGSLVIPSLYSHHLPLMLLGAAALVAGGLTTRGGDESGGDERAATSPEPSLPCTRVLLSALGAALLAVVAVPLSLLLGAALGDTVHLRAQFPFLLAAGVAAGLLAARWLPRDDAGQRVAMASALAAFAVSLIVGLALWNELPDYFANFQGYFERYNMMKKLAERELVKLVVAAFFVVPAAASAGLLVSLAVRRPQGDVRRPNDAARAQALGLGAALLAAAAAAPLAAFVLLPGAGSHAMLVAAGLVALAAAAVVVIPVQDTRRLRVGAVLATAAVLALVLPERADLTHLASGSGRWFSPQEAGGTEEGEAPRPPVQVRSVAGLARALVVGPGGAAAALAPAGFTEVVVPGPDVDARSLLLVEETAYDFILMEAADASNPDASSRLTREFYELLARRLVPGGVLQQELDLESLSALGLTSVLASARQAFGQIWIDVEGNRATLLTCAGSCAAEPAGPWSLDPAATDRLLQSGADRLKVDVAALGSTDLDMFLRYHAPSSFLRSRATPSEGFALLQRFAAG